MTKIELTHFGEDYAKIEVDGKEYEIGLFEATIIEELIRHYNNGLKPNQTDKKDTLVYLPN